MTMITTVIVIIEGGGERVRKRREGKRGRRRREKRKTLYRICHVLGNSKCFSHRNSFKLDNSSVR